LAFILNRLQNGKEPSREHPTPTFTSTWDSVSMGIDELGSAEIFELHGVTYISLEAQMTLPSISMEVPHRASLTAKA